MGIDSQGQAHPRAGGENKRLAVGEGHVAGSSPRGRGKLSAVKINGTSLRLIPARAGKTATPNAASCGSMAHPRAGGENALRASFAIADAGSSPRGRGKRQQDIAVQDLEGLIPARAGKTAPQA